MNPEQIRSLVRIRMGQAGETLADAFALLPHGSTRSVINRAYYGMFYATLALLQTIDQSSSKHVGVISLFDIHFVKTGIIPRDMSKMIHAIFDLRQNSDYQMTESITDDKAKDAVEQARSYIAFAEQYLTRSGLM
jgi:uncharacterized protein (UPF0332 family)